MREKNCNYEKIENRKINEPTITRPCPGRYRKARNTRAPLVRTASSLWIA